MMVAFGTLLLGNSPSSIYLSFSARLGQKFNRLCIGLRQLLPFHVKLPLQDNFDAYVAAKEKTVGQLYRFFSFTIN